MDQKETLRVLIAESSGKLRRAVGDIPEDLFGKRPGPHLNPIGFIYFHVLRCWDEDINVILRDQPPERDAWHRAGLSDELDYEPLGRGRGGRGVGVGFDDDEVDAVPKRYDVLTRYHDLLDAETAAYLDRLSVDELNRARDSGPPHQHLGRITPESMLRMIALHHAEHSGDIKFVKGMLGIPDPTYPGSPRKT